MVRFNRRTNALAILLILLGSGCTETSDVEPDESGVTSVRLALNWYPEAEHGGFYAAETSGQFAANKLNVEIIPGGPNAPQLVISELVAGRIHFAVSDADQVVMARSEGLPIVAVMATMQQSPRCIMVHESTGFERLEDLSNVDLAISESRPFALWMKHRLPLTNVQLVPFNGLVGEFVQNERFAQQGYVFSEPYVARQQGCQPRSLMLSETGFNPYAGLLITTDAMVADHPELVTSVVQACCSGWTAYQNSPDETNAVIHQQNSDMSIEALAFGASAIVDLCRTSADQLPYSMTSERWTTLVKQIEEIGEIPIGSVAPKQCFTAKFVEQDGRR